MDVVWNGKRRSVLLRLERATFLRRMRTRLIGIDARPVGARGDLLKAGLCFTGRSVVFSRARYLARSIPNFFSSSE
jgi:hypothetical protein